MGKRVCVFCGSSTGVNPLYAQKAGELGIALAESGTGIVYGGGRVGLMGILADQALHSGGEVIGVIPQRLLDDEVGHDGLTELVVTRGMHERKAKMSELSNGFLMIPGGIGTLEEFFEIWTWRQLGFHDKPVYVLNTAGFFDPLMRFLLHQVKEGFLNRATYDQIHVDTTVHGIVEMITGSS